MRTLYDVERDQPVEPAPRKRWPYILLGSLAAVLILGGLVVAWVMGQINPSGKPGAEVQITVRQGQSIGSIGSMLESKGVIKNSTIFNLYAKFKGADSVKAGDFTLHKNEHMGAVIDTLEAGPKIVVDRVTIPEGLTLKEIAAKVGALPGKSADQFLAAAGSGTVHSAFQPTGDTNLEGFLMPDTYFVTPKEDVTNVLTRMVGAFDDTANGLGITEGAARLGLTPQQVVIVASLIEREARVDEDRPKIARVIYNRLAKGMPLQIDATVQYALGQQKAKLLNKDLEIDSPYNTYKVNGLPPGPIASPGRKALEAALNPAAGNWLYYVLADTNGRHNFADTPAEFEKFKAEAKAKGLL